MKETVAEQDQGDLTYRALLPLQKEAVWATSAPTDPEVAQAAEQPAITDYSRID
jgi:hypothetical protein